MTNSIHAKRIGIVLLGVATLVACGSNPADPAPPADGGEPAPDGASAADAEQTDAPDVSAIDAASSIDALLPPTQNASVTTFDAAHIYWGAENRREIALDTVFPPHGPWKKVTMHLTLACPQGGCDPWDRAGSIGLIDGTGPDTRALEIARFMTPYGRGGSWVYDVTDLQTLLAGPRTMHAYVDTWVASGWLVTARFDFEAGTPARKPVKVIPIDWNRERLDRDRAVYGDPYRPIPDQLVPRTVALPASGFSQAEVFVITTGHGQGSSGNCAEFCPREHSVLVDGAAHKKTIWRDDCEFNPVQPQNGTWQYDRAGWCPGADVKPWIEDLGTSLAPGSTHTIGYDVQAYTNRCRWDSDVARRYCSACASLGLPCQYDTGGHTEPYFLVSAYLVLFE